MYHPVYRIPCPYINLHDECGSALSPELIKEYLCPGYSEGDNSNFSFELVEDFHPLLDIPFFCPHICTVSDKLSLLEATACSGEHAMKDNLYFLRFLSLVGPLVGYKMGPHQYTSWRESLLALLSQNSSII